MTEPYQALRTSLSGRYDVERELGEGGMATVYLANDVRHGRKVAIKVMRPEIAATLGTERFLAEITLTAKLQHPHILGLIDSGVIGDESSGLQPFYVMPLIKGETLRERLNHGPVPLHDALGVLVEIADALACAHGHDVIHRDIKPENILLSQGHAFVADFGVAKALHRSLDGNNITLTGVSVGTPAYMSPEQAVADPNIDYRADLYALGVVAFEMIAGRTPFGGPTVAAMVKASLTQDAPPLISVAPACPPRLSTLVAALLEKDPNNRPKNAVEVRDTLRSILAFASAETASLPWPARSRRALTMGIGIALVVAVLVGLLVWRPRAAGPMSGAAGVTRAPRSIAVLPFRNINNDSATDYFADGMAEELISALGRLQRLRVASQTSTFAMKGHVGSLADVAKQLGVDAVVESSVRHDADTVLITSSLVDVRNDSTLWAGEYKGGLRNVLYVQDSVAHSIANALSVLLGADAGRALARPRSADPRAYDDYVRGRVFLGERSPVAMASAIRSFQSAIRADSSFAPAYAGLADAYSLVAPFGARPPNEVFPLARAAAERALALDSTLAEAHTSLGIVAMFYDWDWTAARTHLERGIALNPSSAEGHLFYAWYHVFRGHLNEAVAEVTKAQELDQLSAIITMRHGNILEFLGRYADAIPLYTRALVLDSTFFNTRAELAYALLKTGKREEARRMLPQTISSGSGEGAYPAWILAQLGDTAGARAQVKALEAEQARGYTSADALAGAYAAVGDTARALAMLERGADEHAFTLPFLAQFPMFDALHDNPRFKKLVERIGVVMPASVH